MRKVLFTLILLAAQTGSIARAGDSRGLGFFFGLGVAPAQLQLSRDSASASFSVWQASGEAGFNWPFNSTFGMSLSGEYGYAQFENSAGTNFAKETGTWTTKDTRLGFFWDELGFGYAKSNGELKATLVDLQQGSASSLMTGSPAYLFINRSWNAEKRYRFSVEGRYLTGTLGTAKATAYSVGLHLYYLFEK